MTTAFVHRDSVTEWEIHKYCVEASSLRWPPGYFPKVIETNLGNGEAMYLERVDENQTHVYRQSLGCIILEVFND